MINIKRIEIGTKVTKYTQIKAIYQRYSASNDVIKFYVLLFILYERAKNVFSEKLSLKNAILSY